MTCLYALFCRPPGAGFDAVVGNPPYGAAYPAWQRGVFRRDYAAARTERGVQKGSLDTFALFVELGYGLLRRGGVLALIVPIAVTSSDSMTGLHRLLLGGCGTVRVASFAVAPRPIFPNAVVNTSILMFRKTLSECRHVYSTKMYRRDGEAFDLQRLMGGLQFTDVRDFMLDGRIPKIGTELEKSILGKLRKHERLAGFLDPDGSPLFYRTSGGRYFKVVTSYPTGSTKEKAVFFARDYAAPIGCALSSNLSFWFYQIYGNNLDWKSYELLSFTMPRLTEAQRAELSALYDRYLADIEANCDRRTTSAGSRYGMESFRWYKIVRSKPIIDEIDDYLGPLYGLTAEEVDFVKNYELRFRMSGE